MNIEKIRQEYMKEGYTRANAIAKVCQDIILNEIAKSPYFKNVTIKGGVVMHSISSDKRRATRDIDLDFIKYSLEDKSISKFIDKLNDNDDGIIIKMDGKPEPLHHQDYDGKRVNIIVNDSYNNTMKSKLDIGVHKNFDLEQEEYCFDLNALNATAILFINSVEQIFIEKLKSLLKFGALSTRYKDIFDFYYLINNANIEKEKFNRYMKEIIYNDESMQEKDINDVIIKIKTLFSNKIFIANLKDARNNWLGIQVDEVLESILKFLESLTLISVDV
ncbi:MAG: nucleotidyl transferase AbiEii/AbiGii toxin family protein [Clostridia bacterium]|nr:nucleotidyl transferase AbiEii/AbiGii toxin family protein [Clostridia bacterium]